MGALGITGFEDTFNIVAHGSLALEMLEALEMSFLVLDLLKSLNWPVVEAIGGMDGFQVLGA